VDIRTVRRACIDIGSNTTRLLVAETEPGRLLEVHQERAFTRIGAELRHCGEIGPAKIAEVAQVVCAQLEQARAMGAEEVWAVATAAIRRARNGDALIAGLRDRCGLEVRVLSGEEEARLAFLGASSTLDHQPTGRLGVADVGGGSSELVVGDADQQGPMFAVSLPFGSGDLADGCLHSDPPTVAELAGARGWVEQELAGLTVPSPAEAVAVGGSATSLRRLAGPVLDLPAFERALSLLGAEAAGELARRFALDRERVRLLPAGLLILQGIAQLFGTPLQVGRGGVREGVLLEAAG
jgi:exopolyphosphatase/guanosine-5'-triphosphate,3'-diphosphate pyrophosphatase